ncbi:MAG: ATP-binding cassette domain-containing protein, partial [Sedimentisphaerales bacterium]|nr:ATP-binding cassette domain-containing protein [Sedimentisphaerales bacterium]
MAQILISKQVCKSYRMGQNRLAVLRGVDFAMKAGEFVAIIGASGSGKSTFLHILGALDKPDSGQVFFENQRLDSFRGARLNHFRNKRVGFVFQFYHLLDELTVLENAVLPAMAATGTLGWLGQKKQVLPRARRLLEQMGLAQRLRHKPYQLSGGERQRVAIARA